MRTLGRLGLLALSLAIAIPPAYPAGAGTDPSASAAGDGRWRRHSTTGPAPSIRSAPVAAGMGTSLYVFGGVTDDFATGQNAFHNDLHRLDTRTYTWVRLAPAGPVPAARAFAAGAAQPVARRFFVFGGAVFDASGTLFEPFDDLWAYSAATNRWSRPAATNAGPSARSGSVMWVVRDRLYLFGGIDATFATLNELWTFDLRRSAWTRLSPSGAAPPGRHVAQAGTVDRFGRLTFYGGEAVDPEVGFVQLNDTWEYDIDRNRWREVTPAFGDIDPPRNYGASAVVGAALYLQGGDAPGGGAGCGAPFPQNPIAELWRFDLARHTWRRLSPGGDPLVRLKRHAAATVDGRMYVVSGWDFRCDGDVGPGQVWNRDVFSFTP
jgi:N-acetylneuraminic acid mutarotase